MNEKNKLRTPGSAASTAPANELAFGGPIWNRLVRGVACLEQIDRRRAEGRHSIRDRIVGKWIVWRELLALERQNFTRR